VSPYASVQAERAARATAALLRHGADPGRVLRAEASAAGAFGSLTPEARSAGAFAGFGAALGELVGRITVDPMPWSARTLPQIEREARALSGDVAGAVVGALESVGPLRGGALEIVTMAANAARWRQLSARTAGFGARRLLGLASDQEELMRRVVDSYALHARALFVGIGAAPSVGAAPGKSASVKAGEQYHELAAEVMPIAEGVVEFEQALFSVADELGIGGEVRELYFGAAWGTIIGTSVANLGAAVAVGGAYATLGAWAATAGLAVGVVAGVAVALVSIFGGGDDSEEKRAKYDKAVAKARAEQTKRLPLAGLVAEQREAWKVGQNPAAILWLSPEARKAAELAGKLATLYERVGARLSAPARELFVSATNIARWTRFRAAWATREAQARATAAKLPVMAPVVLAVAAEAAGFVAELDKRIAAEVAHLDALSRQIAAERAAAAHKPKPIVRPMGALDLKRPSSGRRLAAAAAAAVGFAAWAAWRILRG
jgi:hypothetical protein